MQTRHTAVRTRCPVCSTPDPAELIEVRGVPVLCNQLWPTRAEALAAPRGDLALSLCGECGHVFNRAFDPGLVVYTTRYDNSLHFSPRFQEHAEMLARRLIERHGLRGKSIIEIGCGKGDFLRMLCSLGGNRGIGFDTSYEPREDAGAAADGVTFVRDYYSEKCADCQADMVCFRHVLEHVADPAGFLRGVRAAAGGRPGAVVYAEVPNSRYTFEQRGIWDLIYEHCSYFSADSLVRLFGDSGFDVLDLFEGFEGQFLGIEAAIRASASENGHTAANGRAAANGHTAADPVAFSRVFRETLRERGRFHEDLQRNHRRAVVWGAGSKGITYLNLVARAGKEAGMAANGIEYLVDLNPGKHGRHVPGTGQMVVAPEFLREYKPDIVLVVNPNYRAEIQGMVRDLGLDPRLVLV